MNATLIDPFLLERLGASATKSPRKRAHHCFHQKPEDRLQRMVMVMEPESYVTPHRHSQPQRDETLLILQGQGAVLLFSDTGQLIESWFLDPKRGSYGADIPAGVYHSLVAYTPGTSFFECKAGPYHPTDPKDFAPWAPREGESQAAAYHRSLLEQSKARR